jgi:hypothetical protein
VYTQLKEKKNRIEQKKKRIDSYISNHTHKDYKVSLAGWHNEGRLLLKEKLFPLPRQTLSEKTPLP